jgi:hypothetical protein
VVVAAATPDVPAAAIDSINKKLIPVDVLLNSIAELNSSLRSKYQEESECMLLLQALLLLSSQQTLTPDYSNKREQKLHGIDHTQHHTVATVIGTWQVRYNHFTLYTILLLLYRHHNVKDSAEHVYAVCCAHVYA